jgi:hypothetical protein
MVSDVRQIGIHTAEQLVPDHSPFEVEIAIAKLKRYKSPGNEEIRAELIQAGGEILCCELYKLINSVWNKEKLSDQWKESIVVPVHKKGDKTDCSNYRGISLLSVLSDNFLIQNGLKQGDALTPLLLNVVLEYATSKVHGNQVRLKLNGTHQLLVYAGDVNLLSDDKDTIQKNTHASKEVREDVNREKTKYTLLPRHQNAGQNRDIKITNESFDNVAQFRYLGTTITNQNLIQEENQRTWNSGNASYHSFKNLLSLRLLSETIKIRMYRTIILPVVLYGCETWSLTLRE